MWWHIQHSHCTHRGILWKPITSLIVMNRGGRGWQKMAHLFILYYLCINCGKNEKNLKSPLQATRFSMRDCKPVRLDRTLKQWGQHCHYLRERLTELTMCTLASSKHWELYNFIIMVMFLVFTETFSKHLNQFVCHQGEYYDILNCLLNTFLLVISYRECTAAAILRMKQLLEVPKAHFLNIIMSPQFLLFHCLMWFIQAWPIPPLLWHNNSSSSNNKSNTTSSHRYTILFFLALLLQLDILEWPLAHQTVPFLEHPCLALHSYHGMIVD